MAGIALRHCPTCGTDIEKIDLGMRDWTRWLKDLLPGKIAPMDVDFMLERHGKFLVIEWKGPGAYLSIGQRIALGKMHKLGMDVWVVWEGKKYGDPVQVAVLNKYHRVPQRDVETVTVAAFRKMIAQWYKTADEYEEE